MSKHRFWKSTLAATIFISCIVFLLFFRGHWAMRVNWPSDEGCYVGRLASWLGVQITGACGFDSNYFAPGTPFVWFPAGVLARIAALLTGADLEDWIVPFLALWSFFLWGAALYQLSLYIEESDLLSSLRIKRSWMLALGIILCIPALYYSTHRNMMSHSAELLVSIVVLRLIERKLWARACVWCTLLFFTRYNDAPVFLLLLGKVLDSRAKGLEKREKILLGIGVAGVAAVAGWISLVQGYVPDLTLVSVIRDMTWEGVRAFWISPAFGSLWVAPWLVLAWALGLFYWKRLSWSARGAWAWISAEFFLGMAWNGNGSDFGYRYLIGSYAAGIFLWLSILRLEPKSVALPRVFNALTITNAIFLTYVLVIYKTVDGTGAHSPTIGLYDPELLINFIKEPWLRPDAFRVACYQQLPMLTLTFSYLAPTSRLTHALGVSGVNRLMLTVATLGATGYCGAYLVAMRTAENRLFTCLPRIWAVKENLWARRT